MSHDNKPTKTGVWIAIIIVTIIFGLGHLPMTVRLQGSITPVMVIRALVLNGIASIIFGWLYWRRGLESAIVAHFSTDIVLHVLLPFMV
jgi:membrane protease YdiL (CAAX protease family)